MASRRARVPSASLTGSRPRPPRPEGRAAQAASPSPPRRGVRSRWGVSREAAGDPWGGAGPAGTVAGGKVFSPISVPRKFREGDLLPRCPR